MWHVQNNTLKIRDVMFKIFDNAVQHVHKIYLQYFPWKNLSEVPAHCKDNMDKLGPNPLDNLDPTITSQ